MQPLLLEFVRAKDACLSPKDQRWAVYKSTGRGSSQILAKKQAGVGPRRRKRRAGGVCIEKEILRNRFMQLWGLNKSKIWRIGQQLGDPRKSCVGVQRQSADSISCSRGMSVCFIY